MMSWSFLDTSSVSSMQKGGDVKGVFERLARGIKAVGDSVKAESGKDFQISPKFGYIHSCPTNLGTGMRASVHVDLPGWTKDSVDALKARCGAQGLPNLPQIRLYPLLPNQLGNWYACICPRRPPRMDQGLPNLPQIRLYP